MDITLGLILYHSKILTIFQAAFIRNIVNNFAIKSGNSTNNMCFTTF